MNEFLNYRQNDEEKNFTGGGIHTKLSLQPMFPVSRRWSAKTRILCYPPALKVILSLFLKSFLPFTHLPNYFINVYQQLITLVGYHFLIWPYNHDISLKNIYDFPVFVIITLK